MQFRRSCRLRAATAVFGTLAGVIPLEAQELRIECLSFPKQKIEEIELLVGKKKTIPITLQSHTLTAAQKVPRMAIWKFGKSGTDSEGKFTFTTYGSVKPLGGTQEQLLLFLRKGPTAAKGLNVLAIKSGASNFGASEMLLMNLSKFNIRGQVGGRKVPLAPGKRLIIKPSADRGPNLCYSVLQYQRSGQWRDWQSTNWPVPAKARGLIFIYNDPRSPRPKIHAITDALP